MSDYPHGREKHYTIASFLNVWSLGGVQGSRGYVRIRPPAAAASVIAPTGLSAIAVSSSQVALSWSDHSANEDGFIIERLAPPDKFFRRVFVTGPNATAHVDSGLHESIQYAYRVKAFSGLTHSAYSNTSCTTTLAGPNSLAAPTNLHAAAVSANQIVLSWQDASSNEAGFKVERRRSYETDFTHLATVPAQSTNFADSGLQAGQTYYYRVRAFSSVAHSSYSNVASATTHAGVALPQAPSGAVASAAGPTQVIVSWQDNSVDEDGFQIERSLDNAAFALIATTAPNTQKYVDSGLQASTTYFYRVRSFNSAGTSWSNSSAGTTPPGMISGSLDPTFAGTGYLSHHDAAGGAKGDHGRAVAIDSQQRIVVAGYSWGVGGNYDMVIWRYKPDGSPDHTFGGSGHVTFDNVFFSSSSEQGLAVAVDSRDRIVVAGTTNGVVGGGYALAVWRYNVDGTLDTTFNRSGYVFFSNGPYSGHAAICLAVDQEGRLVVAGQYKSGLSAGSRSDIDLGIWRFRGDGSLDTSFAGKGYVTHHNAAGGNGADKATGVAIDAMGRIVVCGTSEGNGTGTDAVVWRFNSDGTIDTSFNGVGFAVHNNAGGSTVPHDDPMALAIDGNGRIVVTGRSNAPQNGAWPDMVIWRYLANGVLDSSFNGQGFITHNNAAGANAGDGGYALALDSSGRIVVAGWSQGTVGINSGDMVVWRYNSDGTLDTSFGGVGYIVHHNAAGGNGVDVGFGVAIDAQERIVVVGESRHTPKEYDGRYGVIDESVTR